MIAVEIIAQQEDPNSPERVVARASQEDPIIMYLIVRESLNMSIGKTAAQCAHAAQMLMLKTSSNTNALIFEKWLDHSFRKVILKADEKEWVKLKEILNKDDYVVVIDAGLTELIPGTETIIGVMPLYKSTCPKLIRKLQILK